VFLLALGAGPAAAAALVVCADPNNMPFSNRAGQGFENHLATLLARELKAELQYEWWAQRRGFARHTLGQSKCDIWPGVARGIPSMLTTHPYYRSTYVFLSVSGKRLEGLSLDDPRLRGLVIGVQLIGDDAMNTPPAHALARRGLIQNIRGYMLYGDYHRPNPPASIVDAVAHHEVDVALVWGPLAGYFARREPQPLHLEAVIPEMDQGWPMAFDISVGVRKDEPALREKIDAALSAQQPSVNRLLREFGVPQAPPLSAQARPQ
jgi:mxaJ protein